MTFLASRHQIFLPAITTTFLIVLFFLIAIVLRLSRCYAHLGRAERIAAAIHG
jgi:preprotein translocase subunit SecG